MLSRLILSLGLGFSLLLAGCAPAATATPTAAPTPAEVSAQRLRLTNTGSLAIQALTVRFPEDRLVFGDIAPGETTDYLDVPHGVLRYAAYEFEVDGQVMQQPVIDWVGEEPMTGAAFTYSVDFDPKRANLYNVIQLMGVNVDQ